MIASAVRDHPYAAFLQKVKKPAQYLGGETGEVRKDWDDAVGRMCLAFPDLYEVGMSHLGYKILYDILNRHPKLLAERAYAPWLDLETELRTHSEKLRSLETWRPLSDFDVVGFSLQFELTYVNVLTMMDLAGIPLRSASRDETDPLIVCGGPVATHAEPLAPFVDAFLIGDGEERLPELVLMWAEQAAAGVTRSERLANLSTLEGIYVPALYETRQDAETGFHVVHRATKPGAPLPVQRTFVERLDEYPFPSDGPVAVTETVFDRVSVEVARGCTEGCRFCQAGMIYRPVRERSPTSIVDTIERSVNQGGYDEASLTSLSTADYSAITPLVHEIVSRVADRNVSLSVSSLRAYGLEESVLDDMRKTRAGGLTFAPEAGTQRMRDVINKNVTEEQLLETAERVFSRGWNKMKLYFMIGLPTEEQDDVVGIVETGARAYEVGKRVQGGRGPKVTVSVSTHVPKPHTPFQWCAMDDEETVRAKQGCLKDAAKRTRVQLRLHDSKGSWLEGVLARGDRPLADVIESAWRNGARFDSWQEHLNLDAWERAFAEHGIEPQRYLGTLPIRARLPWDHIDVGLEEGFLEREYRKALKNRLSPPCGKAAGTFVHHSNVRDATADNRRLVCYDCGIACDMSQMRDERVRRLKSLGAETPKAPESAPPQPAKRGKPDKLRSQGPFVRVRLAFHRLGRSAFGSHLDWVRLLPRLFRRADIPLFYSEGFHPKPVMVYGPSLPLGTASCAEFVDVKLRQERLPSVDEMIVRLNAVAVDGLAFQAGHPLRPGDPSISRVIEEVEYVAGLAEDALESLGVRSDELPERIERARQGDLVVRRTVKGLGKNVDVNRYLVDVEAGSGSEWLARAGILGNLYPVRMKLRISPSGTARASEAIGALLGRSDLSARYVRTGAWGFTAAGQTDPLNVEAYRRSPDASALMAP